MFHFPRLCTPTSWSESLQAAYVHYCGTFATRVSSSQVHTGTEEMFRHTESTLRYLRSPHGAFRYDCTWLYMYLSEGVEVRIYNLVGKEKPGLPADFLGYKALPGMKLPRPGLHQMEFVTRGPSAVEALLAHVWSADNEAVRSLDSALRNSARLNGNPP